jgi:hypothetical protein
MLHGRARPYCLRFRWSCLTTRRSSRLLRSRRLLVGHEAGIRDRREFLCRPGWCRFGSGLLERGRFFQLCRLCPLRRFFSCRQDVHVASLQIANYKLQISNNVEIPNNKARSVSNLELVI